MSCWIASSCSSFSIRAVSSAMSLMCFPCPACNGRRVVAARLPPPGSAGSLAPVGTYLYVPPTKGNRILMSEILTTHVGSLPRGEELVPLLLARDHGEPYDVAALERLVQAAVEDAVARQQA